MTPRIWKFERSSNFHVRGVTSDYIDQTYFSLGRHKPPPPTLTFAQQNSKPRDPDMIRGYTDISLGCPTKFFYLSFPELWCRQHEKKNFAPLKNCGGASKPTYSDELHHGEFNYAIILLNFLATFIFIATSFFKNFNKIIFCFDIDPKNDGG